MLFTSQPMENLRTFLGYVQGRTKIRNLPLEVSIESTNVCNFKCVFCPQSKPDHFSQIPRSYLTVDRVELILRKIRQFGYRRTLIHWTLDGEPFMNKDFLPILEAGARHGFTNQYFATNGYFLTKEMVRALPKNIAFTLTLDFCSDAQYFERIRGTPGSWKRIYDNIHDILAAPELQHIRVVVHDISTFSLNDPRELSRRKNSLKTMFPQNTRLAVYSKTFHNGTGDVGGKKIQKTRYYVCPYPWSSLHIAANGDVVPCCRDLGHKTVLGNILKDDLTAIWNGTLMSQFRENLVNRKPELNTACDKCDLPFDDSKFSMGNKIKHILTRLQIFKN